MNTIDNSISNILSRGAEFLGKSDADESTTTLNPMSLAHKRFRVTEHAVETCAYGSNKQANSKWVWLCSHLEILALTRAVNGASWGMLLAVKDDDGFVHEVIVPKGLFAGSGEEYRRQLFDHGFRLAHGKWAKEALQEYLTTAQPANRARSVDQVGWHDEKFVLPDECIGGQTGTKFVLQHGSSSDLPYSKSGTIDEWKSNVASLADGNSRLLFAVSASFAAPLVNIAGAESGGFHFRGGSSTGKSTVLTLAASVWGKGSLDGYIKQWRATDNALEGLALLHCDTPLMLDELGQVESKAAGQAAYMLANGSGKARSNRDGSAKSIAKWRCLFLSTGEIGLTDKLAETGQKIAAGMAIRVLDIRADAGCGLGIFDKIALDEDAGDYAQKIKYVSSKYYGLAGPMFVSKLIEQGTDNIRNVVREITESFLQTSLLNNADGQVRRAATRFALVAAAGELAITFGIVPWREGSSLKASLRCFGEWLEERGGDGAAEITEAKNRLKSFLESHGASRFEDWSADFSGRAIPNRAGFIQRYAENETGTAKKSSEFFILTSVWRGEIMAGLDQRSVNAALIKDGTLIVRKDNKASSSHTPPALGSSIRLYRINPGFLSQ